jgi:HAD superfamily hydrolase (TIGR01484 family)
VRYLVLAVDYDGTLAHDGRVDAPTIASLERLRASGRRLVMVTGRELPDLLRVFDRFDLFDRVVAENGALLYDPAAPAERRLADRPDERLVARLRRLGVEPLSVGHSIVATREPHEATAVEVIRELGLELHVIFNKGAVMILPSGVNKATGLAAALAELGLSAHNAVGVGDAENDHAFLAAGECAVAVANALPALKERADLVTRGARGAGVVELVDRLLADDLADAAPRLARHRVLLGARADGDGDVALEPHGTAVLVAGPSASGKSTVATAVLERLHAAGRQFCLIDPEGDYGALPVAASLGDPKRVPGADEVLGLLEDPHQSLVVNLLGVPLADRPAYFAVLLPHLQELRARTGRPHWLVVDEAHHLLPPAPGPPSPTLDPEQGGLLLVTVHPDWVAPAVLRAVDTVVAVGDAPVDTLRGFAAATAREAPAADEGELARGEALVWRVGVGPPVRVRVALGRLEHQRHRRKYAEGDLGPERSFYFRGPEDKLHLRAQNLAIFVQIADGVDDATWLHHLRRGNYSAWFRDLIKDDALANEAERIERRADLSAAESRRLIAAAIEREYTAGAARR